MVILLFVWNWVPFLPFTPFTLQTEMFIFRLSHINSKQWTFCDKIYGHIIVMHTYANSPWYQVSWQRPRPVTGYRFRIKEMGDGRLPLRTVIFLVPRITMQMTMYSLLGLVVLIMFKRLDAFRGTYVLQLVILKLFIASFCFSMIFPRMHVKNFFKKINIANILSNNQ